MRCFVMALLALSPLLAAAAPPPAPAGDDKSPLAVGKDLPAALHPFHVTGPSKGRYHDPVAEHALDPVVLIFSRDLDVSDPLKDLLQKLDAVIDKNPPARIRGVVVFLTDDLPDVITEDDKREELAT